MAKRSPILGYNHNVRYRGLVFHVQTEDSGVLAPHLFTHLFHSGVIVSTRKYVYDAGSTEEAIKSLMQAQHKAVMKELRRGLFDDKIDQYLGGTPGLLPREGAAAPDGAAPDGAAPDGAAPDVALLETARDVEATDSDRIVTAPPAPAPPRGLPAAVAAAAGLISPSIGDDLEDDELGGATLLNAEPAISREMTLEEPALALRPTELAVQSPPPPPVQPRVPARPRAAVIVDDYETIRNDAAADSQPEITIQLEAEEPDAIPVRHRRPADTITGPLDQARLELAAAMVSDGVPGMLPGAVTIRNPGEVSGPIAVGATGPVAAPLSQRAVKAVGAASLPPARPISRPPTRPAIPIIRPPTSDERRAAAPDSTEVYVMPSSAELAVSGSERAGQYAQHNKPGSRLSPDGAPDGAAPPQGAIPPPSRPSSTPVIPPPAKQGQPAAAAPRATPPPSAAPVRPSAPAQSGPIPMPPRASTPSPAPQVARPAAVVVTPHRHAPTPGMRDPGTPRPRTPTPQRVSMSTPATGMPGLGSRTGTPGTGTNVVMTRPAVIVGAPAKPGASTQRVRKAREDEGRSFGQGLISEKSLDEVILAYLSEDAEDK